MEKTLTPQQRAVNNTSRKIEQDLNFVTGAWVRNWGISNWDLTHHPQIDDVILLIKIRQTCWHYWQSRERGYWSYVWDWCYHKKYSLKNKHLDKLQNSIYNSEHRQKKLRQRTQAKNSGTKVHTAPGTVAIV